jgi:prophage regulatory protein
MLIKLPKVKAETGLGRSTIYRRARDGTFPAPIKTGPRSSAWIYDEVEAWVKDRIAASRSAAARQ